MSLTLILLFCTVSYSGTLGDVVGVEGAQATSLTATSLGQRVGSQVDPPSKENSLTNTPNTGNGVMRI